jgi:hypothetical protein
MSDNTLITEPSEMRREIYRMRFPRAFDSSGGPLVHHVMCVADRAGHTDVDRYTMLAYYALKEIERVKRILHDHLMLNPSPPLVVTADERAPHR